MTRALQLLVLGAFLGIAGAAPGVQAKKKEADKKADKTKTKEEKKKAPPPSTPAPPPAKAAKKGKETVAEDPVALDAFVSTERTGPPTWGKARTLNQPVAPPSATPEKPPGAEKPAAATPASEGGQGEEPTLPGAAPQGPAAATGSAARNGGAPQLQMRYHGVAPGRAELPPRPPALPLSGPQQVTFPGFQLVEGTPTIFLQMTGPVEYAVSEKPGQVVVTLSAATVPLRNNLRPLRVEAFRTPVQRVRLESQPKKKTVSMIVEVKGRVAHHERMDQGANGYSMLVLQITPVPADAAAADPPKAEKAPAAVEKPAGKKDEDEVDSKK